MTPHFHYYPSPNIKVKKVEPPKEQTKIVLTEKDWKELDKDCEKYHEEKDNNY